MPACIGGQRRSARGGIPFHRCPSRQRAPRRPPFCVGRGLENHSLSRWKPLSAATPDRALSPSVQEPHAPFLLAGGGEKTTLRQVARFADAANMGAYPAIGQPSRTRTSPASSIP